MESGICIPDIIFDAEGVKMEILNQPIAMVLIGMDQGDHGIAIKGLSSEYRNTRRINILTSNATSSYRQDFPKHHEEAMQSWISGRRETNVRYSSTLLEGKKQMSK